MSLLADILSTADDVKIKDIELNMPILKRNIEDEKNRLTEYLENVYINFSERSRKNDTLLNNVQKINKDISVLKDSLEDLRKRYIPSAHYNMDKLIENMNIITATMDVLLPLYKISEQLHIFDTNFKSNEFIICSNSLNQIESLFAEELADEDLDVLPEIKMEFLLKKNNFATKLEAIFKGSMIIQSIHSKKNVLKIKKENESLKKVLRPLYVSNSLVALLSTIARSLWTYFFIPTVDHTVNLIITSDENFHILEINIDSSEKSSYESVFSNIKMILSFLKLHFEMEVCDNTTTMFFLAEDIKDNLSELIIKQCLKYTIPCTTSDLKNYDVVIKNTKDFEKSLKSFHIFTENMTSLTDYTKDVEKHFLHKQCLKYVAACDAIMRKDLHDMKEVGVPHNPHSLSSDTDNFPQCCVSSSALEMMQLLENIIIQDIFTTETGKSHLLCAVMNIIMSYGDIIPKYHSKLLQTIPQQVALFQNNCNFIAHKLSKWSDIYSTRLNNVQLDLQEVGHHIQQKGVDYFTNYVSKTTESFNIVGIEGPAMTELSPEAEKSIRKCMRQQELLKTVWQKVLTYKLYNDTMGTILNTMCCILINSVVAIEDISSKAAEQLVEVLKIVSNRGPKIFTDANEICLFVPLWYKFNELNFVLAASLADINDRWADGKGALALQFTPNELKSLIRALFQNTNARAAVLANIMH